MEIPMLNLFAYFLFSFILTFIIIAAAYFINAPSSDYEKHSAYECGFEPFGDARSFFDIHFYTVGLLFIIFDLEVVFLIPFVVNLAALPLLGYLTMLFFMAIVIVGFYYEWAIGLLE
jgi:NADH:ubiquinone oxidoreductase subunit 3 (subunit A)